MQRGQARPRRAEREAAVPRRPDEIANAGASIALPSHFKKFPSS
jgi:hypothetical protein